MKGTVGSTWDAARTSLLLDQEEPDLEMKRNFPVPMIYVCATMWHETTNEMVQLLKSIFRFVTNVSDSEKSPGFVFDLDWIPINMHVEQFKNMSV